MEIYFLIKNHVKMKTSKRKLRERKKMDTNCYYYLENDFVTQYYFETLDDVMYYLSREWDYLQDDERTHFKTFYNFIETTSKVMLVQETDCTSTMLASCVYQNKES